MQTTRVMMRGLGGLAGMLSGVALLAAPVTPAAGQSAWPPAVPAANEAPVPQGATFDPPNVPDEQQRQFMRTAARTAWNYVRRNYSQRSGLVRALDKWEYVTIWDIASTLAAFHSARGLGLISERDYRRRMDRALRTVERMPLYMDIAFNKQYSARSGAMVDRNQRLSKTGYGWSAIDLGRFLVWMKIIAETDSVARPAVERIVARLAFNQLESNGYLRGGNIDVNTNRHLEYQEGRLGYEQYAALGFSLWGKHAANALDFAVNGEPVDVFGHRILSDRRGDDMVTSEPYVMAGIELGWVSPTWEEQARNVLAAQQERFRRTGVVTMVSEDAVPLAPTYFYYYGVLRDRQPFVVQAPGGGVSDDYPRWVSTKAAFGYHALFPSDYTWKVLQTVRPAGASGRGWTAGVFERSKRATPSFNLNTAAVVLEAAYYAHRNCPLIKPRCP